MDSRGRTLTLVLPVLQLLKHGTAVLHTGRYVYYYIVHYLLNHELQLLYYMLTVFVYSCTICMPHYTCSRTRKILVG